MKCRAARIPTVASVCIVALLLLGWGQRPARADHPENACVYSSKPSSEASWGGTYDALYVTQWPLNAQNLPAFKSGLKLDPDDWSWGLVGFDAFGYNSPTNLSAHMSRLMNAAWIVTLVQSYAVDFGLPFSVSGLPNPIYDDGWYWDFVVNASNDEWVPSCEMKDSLATVYSGVDEHVALHFPGAFEIPAVVRAGTLVHETVHESVGHIDSEDCTPETSSCDPVFGDYNADTMGLMILLDAWQMYETVLTGNGRVHDVATGPGPFGTVCEWIPSFSNYERKKLKDRAESVSLRFQNKVPGQLAVLKAQVKGQFEAEWNCEVCDEDDYSFDPSSCTQPLEVCNETLNQNNAAVNAAKRQSCNAYTNAAQAPGSNPGVVAQAKQDFEAALLPLICHPPDEQDARAYCDAEKASADHVDDIDECGWLESVTFPSLAGKTQCVQEYCHETYDEVPWNSLQQGADPLGCLEYLCGSGDGGCSWDLSEEDCRFMFHAAQGDPDWYLGSCEGNNCERVKVQCLLAALKNDPDLAASWEPGDPLPTQCGVHYQVCQVHSRLAAEVMVNHRAFLDPLGPLVSPVWEVGRFGLTAEQAAGGSPAQTAGLYLADLAEAARSGASDEELADMALTFSERPEIAAALYNTAPEVFSAIFQPRETAEIFAPTLTRGESAALDPEDLNAAGRAALAELQRSLAEAPAEMRDAMFGQLDAEMLAEPRVGSGRGVRGGVEAAPVCPGGRAVADGR